MQRLSLGSPLALGNPEISSIAPTLAISIGSSGQDNNRGFGALVIFLPVLLEFAHVYINGPPEATRYRLDMTLAFIIKFMTELGTA
jgi:hypothetical protein